MSDLNPYALSTVDRLAQLPLRQGRSGLQALLRNGNVTEARVIAMLPGDMAELEILDQRVEVRTPRPLEVGSIISVAVNRTRNGLELVIQPDPSRSAPTPQFVARLAREGPGETTGGLQPSGASIEDWVLAAQAAINEAVLSSEANLQRANLPSAQPSVQQAAQAYAAAMGFAPQSQLQATVRTRYQVEGNSFDPDENDGFEPRPSAYKAAEPTAQTAAYSAASGQPASKPVPAIVTSFHPPHMPHPILLTIEQEEENEAQQTPRSKTGKRWSVNFSLDTGSIGRVHVTIALSTSVSIRLSSEEAHAAFLLSAWLPELKMALEAADFTVEDLWVREGGRSETANAASVLL